MPADLARLRLQTLQTILLVAPVLLFSVIAHEIAHGYVALRQGDRTALEAGRLSWNPAKHIDLYMTILLPLIMLTGSLLAGGRGIVLGGAKPVPVDPRNYRHIRRGDILVSLAGVFTNFLIALACAGLIAVTGLMGRAVPALEVTLGILQAMFVLGIQINAVLIAFNLLPIPAARRLARGEVSAAAAARDPLRPVRALRHSRPRAAAQLRREAARGVAHPRHHVLSVGDRAREQLRAADRHAVAAMSDAVVAHGFGTDVAGPAAFVVELTEFSGPLDLLLTLIREEQVDIYDIPIARMAEQFLVRIRTLQLNEAADYLEMAARLLRIKAQMLLPRTEGEDGWDDPRAELVRRLLEYQQMREVVDVLERAGEERRNRFARAYLPQAAAPPEAPLALSLSELLAAVDRILRVTKDPAIHDVVPRSIDVPGAIGVIRALLAIRARAMWTDLVQRGAEPWQVLSTLLGLLEMAKLGECRVQQPRPFANVEISRDAASEAA